MTTSTNQEKSVEAESESETKSSNGTLGIKIVIGGGVRPLFYETETSSVDVPAFFDQLARYGIDTIDSAALYGDVQRLLGKYRAVERGFNIDTKLPGGFQPGSSTEEGVTSTTNRMLEVLGGNQINILYLHSPDPTVLLASTLSGIDKLYRRGAFRRFGLSNYTPQQVRAVYDHCKEHKYILPTVYQGAYNAFARHYEAPNGLFSVLRELNMSFYAYSPAAGGYLSKTVENLYEAGSRFDRNSSNPAATVYRSMYSERPALAQAHVRWNEIAKTAGISPGAMALRWVRYNSTFLKPEFGDAMVVGGRTAEQRDDTLRMLTAVGAEGGGKEGGKEKGSDSDSDSDSDSGGGGPLPQDVVDQINAIWETIKHEAPTDNYHDFLRENSQVLGTTKGG